MHAGKRIAPNGDSALCEKRKGTTMECVRVALSWHLAVNALSQPHHQNRQSNEMSHHRKQYSERDQLAVAVADVLLSINNFPCTNVMPERHQYFTRATIKMSDVGFISHHTNSLRHMHRTHNGLTIATDPVRYATAMH